jgi:HEAT repeat protein
VARIGRLAPPLAVLLAAAVALAQAPPTGPAPAPAAGGSALLAAAETARAVVVGRVRAPQQLDLHGWRAGLTVERVLAGDLAAGGEQAIGWEELATRRPARFADGARVLLALEPLPPGSLWSQRFPRRDALAVAARGDAFVREPDARTLEPLAAFLALAPEAREQAAGISALCALSARGEPRVAGSALSRLGGIPALKERLPADAPQTLAGLIRDAARPPEVRRAALALVAARELRALEPAVDAVAAQPGPVQGDAVDALGRLRGGFPPERAAALLASDDPAVRAAAARRAADGVSAATLRKLVGTDPAGVVRGAAAEALAAREGEAAVPALIVALREADPDARAGAMRGIVALGPAAALPALRSEIWESDPGGPPERLAGAVLVLTLLGPEGLAELSRIAHEHPSPKLRRVAELGLGRLEDRH